MKPNLLVYTTDSTDPYLNLATESRLYSTVPPNTEALFLWRNSESVVIGRSQNPWIECRMWEIEEAGINLVRRQSGGGAVYHDMGNTNFTFFSEKGRYSKERNLRIIVEALRSLGIQADINARNDILVDGKKVSGSAFRLGKSRNFHHGTLLLQVDLDRLFYLLNPSVTGIESKGVTSVKSSVANLRAFSESLTHDALCRALMESLSREYRCGYRVIHLRGRELLSIPEVSRDRALYSDRKWILGKTPPFTVSFIEEFYWGKVELHIRTKQGCIESVSIISNALSNDLREALMRYTVGIDYSVGSITAMMDTITQLFPAWTAHLAELTSRLTAKNLVPSE